MNTTIICPNCDHEFQPTDAIRTEVEKQLRSQMVDWQKKKEAEFDQQMQQKEQEVAQQFAQEKEKLSTQIEENIRKQVVGDYEVQMKFLKEANEQNEEKLKQAREKELAFMKQEQELKRKEEELQLQLQQMLRDEKLKLEESIRKQEEEKNFMKFKQLEKQLEDQKKIAEDAVRKAEQASMQLQGEVQELALEELLKTSFPFDVIEEVGKGIRGADCMQTVRNNLGNECGTIIYESKRTKDFSNEWIEKLKADMRNQGADIAVIVTQAMPKDLDMFGEKDGVWICSFSEVKAVTTLLRESILRIYNATKSQENKGDKMTLLYNYLTGSEFSEQWKAMREGFARMKALIQKERDQMERIWKAREKQLEKILLNANHISGSIQGIAGAESIDMQLLDGHDNDLIE